MEGVLYDAEYLPLLAEKMNKEKEEDKSFGQNAGHQSQSQEQGWDSESEPVAETDTSWESQKENLLDKSVRENQYFNLHEFNNYKEFIVDYKKVLQEHESNRTSDAARANRRFQTVHEGAERAYNNRQQSFENAYKIRQARARDLERVVTSRESIKTDIKQRIVWKRGLC